MEGWIKLHRKFTKWEWFNDSNMVHLFLYLLLQSNHEPNRWKGIEVDRGQIITGLKSLSKNTGISIQSIRTSLDRLISTGEITRKPTNKYSIITICKYDDYQLIEGDANNQNNKLSNKQLTINQQSTNNQLTPNKNDKKEKNLKNEKNKTPFDSEIFKSSWESWVQYRIEKKQKLTPSTIKSQLKKLGGYPEDTAIKVIEQSICNGWTGLFELKENGQPGAYPNYYNQKFEKTLEGQPHELQKYWQHLTRLGWKRVYPQAGGSVWKPPKQ